VADAGCKESRHYRISNVVEPLLTDCFGDPQPFAICHARSSSSYCFALKYGFCSILSAMSIDAVVSPTAAANGKLSRMGECRPNFASLGFVDWSYAPYYFKTMSKMEPRKSGNSAANGQT
jgi:hypothetical protein